MKTINTALAAAALIDLGGFGDPLPGSRSGCAPSTKTTRKPKPFKGSKAAKKASRLKRQRKGPAHDHHR